MREHMEAIVREAGTIALKYHGGLTKTDIDFKSEADLVTRADREVEDFIASQLRAAYPWVHFVGEETAAEMDYRSGEAFVLDPIDGTTNYVHGLPYFAISLAYLRDGVPQAAVVYAPALDALYSAESGQGALLNNEPIRASQNDDPGHSLAVTGFVNLRSRVQPDNLAAFGHVAYQVRSVLRLGSAAVDLCYVADGKMDFFWEHGLNVWDVAAGALIVQEAGGVVTGMDGGPDYLSGRCGILAGGPNIHGRAVRLLKEAENA
ncbi:inositol monophosphatase family protein [Spirochaeta africana]|nr:inositol monophosphatase family protein [Spirochaeta africana]